MINFYPVQVLFLRVQMKYYLLAKHGKLIQKVVYHTDVICFYACTCDSILKRVPCFVNSRNVCVNHVYHALWGRITTES